MMRYLEVEMCRIRNKNRNQGEESSDDRRCRRKTLLKVFVYSLLLGVIVLSARTKEATTVYSMPETPDAGVYSDLALATFYQNAQESITANATDASFSLSAEIPVKLTAINETEVFNVEIPLSKELQQYLYDLCCERELDYKTVLAIIMHESNFNPDALGGGSNYGLFQINTCNHKTLSAALDTENKPFDPRTNINWGTYLLSRLYDKYSQYYQEDELTRAVLSAYNKGEGGFEKNGFAVRYLEDHERALERVNSWFN